MNQKPDLWPRNSWHNIQTHNCLLAGLSHKYYCILSYIDQSKGHTWYCIRLDYDCNSRLSDIDYADLSDSHVDSFDFIWGWHLHVFVPEFAIVFYSMMSSFPILTCTVVYYLIIITDYIIIASIFITSHFKINFTIMIWTICTFICCHFCIAVKIGLSCETSLIAVFIGLMTIDCDTFLIAVRVQGFIARNISITASEKITVTVIWINASWCEARWLSKWWNLAHLWTKQLCLLRANWNKSHNMYFKLILFEVICENTKIIGFHCYGQGFVKVTKVLPSG